MPTRLSRRTFIKTTAGACSLAGLGGCANNNSKPKIDSNPLQIGLMTYNLARDWDIDTIIKNCTETKFEQVELRTTHAHGVEVSLSKDQRSEVRKKFENSAIKSISLASGFQYHFPDQNMVRENIEGTKKYTLLAHDIGALGIRVFPNSLMIDQGIEETRTLEQIGNALRECGEFAKDYGVEIRVCVHGKGTNKVSIIRKILDFADSPHVYVNWNCNLEDIKGKGFVDNFNLVKDKIRGVHMHELWDERYPYREFFTMLKSIRYKGYCNAEIPESIDPIRIMKYYRALFLAFQNAL